MNRCCLRYFIRIVDMSHASRYFLYVLSISVILLLNPTTSTLADSECMDVMVNSVTPEVVVDITGRDLQYVLKFSEQYRLPFTYFISKNEGKYLVVIYNQIQLLKAKVVSPITSGEIVIPQKNLPSDMDIDNLSKSFINICAHVM